MTNMDELIKKYSLQKHPEGGYFAETFRSESILTSPINDQKRAAVTDIYYLLTKGEISRFHKVSHDEIWHFYEGDPLMVVKFDGNAVSEYLIGPACPDGYKVVVEGGCFQAAVPQGEYSLLGCTVAPGFDFADFSFLLDFSEEASAFEVKYSKYQKLL